MAIDLNSCIGCQACVVACQAENNIPVVGKEQVLDAAASCTGCASTAITPARPTRPTIAFEPVPCMHCENAPCEVVCPVHATVHDHEGLNVMVYNRCVGTRFCSNNCPYKVRRFNFFAYARERRPAARNRGTRKSPCAAAASWRNAPTASSASARRRSTPTARTARSRDGEIVTACQQSCPTQAIVFGDRNDRDSAVAKRKASPLDYVLLDELNTRPRTSYAGADPQPQPGDRDGQNASDRLTVMAIDTRRARAAGRMHRWSTPGRHAAPRSSERGERPRR